MTEPRRRTRWSRGRLRLVAWTAGVAAFVTGGGILGATPAPSRASAPPDRPDPPRRHVVIRRITRRVIIVEPAVSAPVTYVQAPSTSSSSQASSSAPVPAPAPAPPPSTGGS